MGRGGGGALFTRYNPLSAPRCLNYLNKTGGEMKTETRDVYGKKTAAAWTMVGVRATMIGTSRTAHGRITSLCTSTVPLSRGTTSNRTYGTPKKTVYFDIFTNNIWSYLLFDMAPRQRRSRCPCMVGDTTKVINHCVRPLSSTP